jgi:hypothetical protein
MFKLNVCFRMLRRGHRPRLQQPEGCDGSRTQGEAPVYPLYQERHGQQAPP